MSLLAVFLVVFIGGPLVFRLLTRGKPDRRSLRALVLLRRAYPGPVTQRWTNVLGILATTLPWFGLIWASTVAA